REKQVAHNEEHGIDPTPLRKRIGDILDDIYATADDTETLVGGSGRQQSRGKAPVPQTRSRAGAVVAAGEGVPREELTSMIATLNDQMLTAARELQFEVAARY